MKNVYSLFLILLCSSVAYAQTITSDWFFAPGDSIQVISAINPDVLWHKKEKT